MDAIREKEIEDSLACSTQISLWSGKHDVRNERVYHFHVIRSARKIIDFDWSWPMP